MAFTENLRLTYWRTMVPKGTIDDLPFRFLEICEN